MPYQSEGAERAIDRGADAAARTKVSPIEEAQDRVSHRIECAHELLTRLESRIDPILRAVPPQDKPGANLAEAQESPLHGRLLRDAEMVRGLCSRLEQIIDRVTT